MKVNFQDWRNIALVAASLLIVILIIVIMTGGERVSGVVVRVGSRNITTGEFNKTLQQRFGEQLLKETITQELVRKYADMKNVSASEAEVDQLVDQQKRGLAQEGYTLEEYLQANNLTLESFKAIQRTKVLKVKMVVSNDEIVRVLPEVVKAKNNLFFYPESYRIRIFGFANEEGAKQALRLLKSAGDDEAGKQQMQQVAGMAINADTAMKIIIYSPEGDKDTIDSELVETAKNLKPGQWSDPIAIHDSKAKPVPDNAKDVRRVIQLIEILPEQPPTMSNRNIIIGMALIQQKREYYEKFGQVEADARQKIDVTFMNNNYPVATKYFNDLYKENMPVTGPPDLPGASGTNAIPSPLPLPDAAPTPPKSGK